MLVIEHLPCQTTKRRLLPPTMNVTNMTELPEEVWSIAPRPEELPDNRGNPVVESALLSQLCVSQSLLPFPSSTTSNLLGSSTVVSTILDHHLVAGLGAFHNTVRELGGYQTELGMKFSR